MSHPKVERFCGNCENHVSYEYPAKIFCSMRYERGMDPIVNTLWNCEAWSLITQECHCVEEALKNGLKVTRQS